jgi:N-methylhydantoinase B
MLVKHEYLCDSAGPGQWRGGLGVETVFKMGSDNTQLVIFGDGDVEPAFGLFSGGDASLNSIWLEYPDGREHSPLSLDLITGVPSGTVYHQLAGGGGGYGNPHDRPAEVVCEEVRNGIISREAAREVYGVVVDEGTAELDRPATLSLRTCIRE